jgi:amino acid transporter
MSNARARELEPAAYAQEADAAPVASSDEGLIRAIGPVGLTAGVINIVVGGAIFVMPATLAGYLGAAAPLAYLVGAVLMAFVTSSFAAVARRTASSGGPYAYVEQAFGLYAGFLAGMLVWLAGVFASAAVAAALIDSLGRILPLLAQPTVRGAALVGTFAVLAAVNIVGVRAGVGLSTAAAIAKFTGLVLFVVLATRLVEPSNLAFDWPSGGEGLGRATILVIFAFAGMEVPLCAGGEIRDPDRTVPRALAIALVLVTVLYISVQLVAQGVLGADIAASKAPLADALARTGPTGYLLLLATGAVSMFGYLAGDILGMSRILFAFGRDRLLPRQLALVHPVTRAPHVAVVVHAIMATALALTGGFALLAPIASVAILLLYIVCCAAALKLQAGIGRVAGDRGRLASMISPALAIVALCWVLAHSTTKEFLWVGVVLALASVLFALVRRRAA